VTPSRGRRIPERSRCLETRRGDEGDPIPPRQKEIRKKKKKKEKKKGNWPRETSVIVQSVEGMIVTFTITSVVA